MSPDEFSQDKFGKILRDALSKSPETPSPDFADNLLKRIQTDQRQKALAKVILQERLSLASCILLPIVGLMVVCVFPQLVVRLFTLVQNLYDTFLQTGSTVQYQWPLWAALILLAGFAIYSVCDLLLTDN